MRVLPSMTTMFLESRKVIHLVFALSFMLVFCLPAVLNDLPDSKLFSLLLYGLFLVVCIYAGRFCCKGWLLTGRFKQFFVYSFSASVFLAFVGIAGLRILTYNGLIAIVITSFVCTISFFLLGIFLSITRDTIKRQLKEAVILQEQKQSELLFLQSQLSPHFLFNTLNNLYGISITRHEQVPVLLLKLSELLRYSVYDSKEPYVPLAEEIQYINNYIDFEKIRIGDRLILKKNIQPVDDLSITIAPLLLIVFIENAFKHSKNSLDEKIYADLSLQVLNGQLFFSVSNTYRGKESSAGYSVRSTGLGLRNVTKRLEMVYGNRYTLSQRIEDGKYTVYLTLKLK